MKQLVSLFIFAVILIHFLTQPPAKPPSFEKLSKEQRIEGMAEQEFLMTRDLETNSISKEGLLKIKQEILQNVYRSNTDLFWEERGPDNHGGRTRTIAFDPSDSTGNTIWTGGVSGGLWKLTNAFSEDYSWESISSYQGNSAISSIVIDKSDSDVIYVSTGENYFNFDVFQGEGIYRSLDGGKNWKLLLSTNNSTFEFVQKLLISGDRLFACTESGGLQMSRDRGETWTRAFVGFGSDPRVGDIDLASDGSLYACKGFYQSDGVYKSTDNGDSWIKLEIDQGIPGRIELAVSESNPNTIYALAENLFSSSIRDILKSTDGGETWTELSCPRLDRPWYNLCISVDPQNENKVIIGAIDLWITNDGGLNWEMLTDWQGDDGRQIVHQDHHFIGYNTSSNSKVAFANDGGVYLSQNAHDSLPNIEWKNQGYNTVQFYSGCLHPSKQNYFLGGTQDNGTHQFEDEAINSTNILTGGDGGYCHIDKDNPEIQIVSYIYNAYTVTLDGWETSQDFIIAQEGGFINPSDYDDQSDKLICSYKENEVLILDIQAGDFEILKLAELNENFITAIKVSPHDNSKIYIGTNDGRIFLVDNLLQGNPVLTNIYSGQGYIRNLEIDLTEEQWILFTISNVNSESIFVSKNGGQTWESQKGDLPSMPVRWGVFNPANPAGIILATELGVWTTDLFSGTDTKWQYNSFGLAPTRVDMLDVRESDFTVLAATHGRGMFTANVCSGLVDNDNDGYPCEDDCNDFNANVNSSMIEIPYNGVDDDCDPATFDDDLDQDGFNLVDDCDDQDETINPSAMEVVGNGVDENCDGLDEVAPCDIFQAGPWDIFEFAVNCSNGALITDWQVWSNEAYVISDLQDETVYYFEFCTGYDPSVFQPMISVYTYNRTSQVKGNLLNNSLSCRIEFEYKLDNTYQDILIIVHDLNDCSAASNLTGNGKVVFGCLGSGIDLDGDGFPDNIDCDDQNAQVNPAATEILLNGIDDDCDPGTLDNDLDGDGYGLDEDCDESNPDINPGADEIPGNGIDEDCDGEDGTVAVQELNGAQLSIFPNPTTAEVYVETSSSLKLYLIDKRP